MTPLRPASLHSTSFLNLPLHSAAHRIISLPASALHCTTHLVSTPLFASRRSTSRHCTLLHVAPLCRASQRKDLIDDR